MKTITLTEKVCYAFIDGEWISEDDRPFHGIKNFDLHLDINVDTDSDDDTILAEIFRMRTDAGTVWEKGQDFEAVIEQLMGPGYIGLKRDWERKAVEAEIQEIHQRARGQQ